MEQINIQAAKTHLSELLEKVTRGESFIIAKAGKPIAVVSAYSPPEKLPRVGFMAEHFTVPETFDNMYSDEIIKMFEGEDEAE